MSKIKLLVISILLFVQASVFAQTPTVLELNKPITLEIKSGETQTFQLNLAENQFAKIVVTQKSIDVSVKLTGFDKEIVDFLNFDSAIIPNNGNEIVEIVSTNNTEFILEITSAYPKSKGSYQILVEEIRDSTEKDLSVDLARKLHLKAGLLGQSRKIDEGLELAKKSLAMMEKEFGVNSFETAKVLFTFGKLNLEKNDIESSLQMYLRSQEIIENLYGKESVNLISVFKNIGKLYFDKQNYLKADEYDRKTISILEKYVDPNHLQIADLLNNFALTQERLGNKTVAEDAFLRSIKIKEFNLGNESLTLADSLMNLGIFYNDKIDKAEPLFLRAIAIQEKLLGKEHPNVAKSLYNLARTYQFVMDNVKAEAAARRSFEILEKALGPNHPNVSFPMRMLTMLYLSNGKYDEAEVLIKRSIANAERIRTDYNPDLASILSISGDVYTLKGELEKAVTAKTKATEIRNQILQLNLVLGSEKDRVKILSQQRNDRDKLYSFSIEHSQKSSEGIKLGLLLALRQKGKAADLFSQNLSSLRASLSESDKKLLDQFNKKNTQLATLILAGKGKLSEENFNAKVSSLTAERDSIEREISMKTSQILDVNKDFTLKQIQDLIPQDSILLEFVQFNPTSLKTSLVGKPHYAVFAFDKNGKIKAINLGEKSTIDLQIAKFRQSLQDPKSVDAKQLARELDEKILSPIREFLGGSNQLLISPDGELNLIPFEALIDKNGKYLVENYSISYLSSGRDLLRMQNIQPNNNSSLIVANPNFGEMAVAQTVKPKDLKRSVNVAKSLSETYFSPLSGTEKEGQEIKKLFPTATLLSGEKATETALKQTKSPNILHIATHGFFIQASEKSAENENPLLRSGLAFASANNRTDKDSDGILTALEGAGLNLFGTKLVVLSACGTGLGEIQTGEGVFGLRRSFVLAGSESLVISLWSVSDYITRELMIDYYKNLKNGFGRGESLRKAQLGMLKNPKRQHPFYWASFIQSGNWRGL